MMLKHLLLALISISIISFIHVSLNPPKVEIYATKPVKAVKQEIKPEVVKDTTPPPTPVIEPVKATEPTPVPAPVVAPAPMPTSEAKAFIYRVESGNNPGAINPSSGACGLGQALPCSKLPCSLQDYACQDAWFTNYMLARYGSWENAVAFWKLHSWW